MDNETKINYVAVFQDSKVVEREYIVVRDEALTKLDQSEQDLEAALDIRNRSLTLLRLTQQQLLDVESKTYHKELMSEESM